MHNYPPGRLVILNLNSRQPIKLLACILAGIPALKTAANGFALPDQDAFATARGEAVAATADNPSAIYYNPAGITQLPGHNVRLGAYVLDYNLSFKPPSTALNAGKTYNEKFNYAVVPRAFYTCTLANVPLSFGLGVYAPFGGKIGWPENTGFRAVATSGKLTYLTVNPVIAWKILPSLSIAAGPMFNYVNLQTDQGLEAFAKPLENYFRFNGDGWSIGANAGILWQPLAQLSFGAMFRSPAKVTLQGQTAFEDQPFIANSSRSASMDLNFPMSVVGGISYRPTPKWNLEFDASYTDWSSFGSTAINQSNPPYPLHSNIPVALNWKPSWIYGFGATRYFESGWNVSAGYAFSGNSVPNDNYTPLAADMDRQFVSVGTGYKGEHLSFDIAYQFGWAQTHTVTGSTPSSTPGLIANQTADGKYDFSSSAISVSVGWHF